MRIRRSLPIVLSVIAVAAVLTLLVQLRKHAPPEPARLLPGGDGFFYVNLQWLRRANLTGNLPPVSHDPEYEQFIQATGFQFERDLDEAAFAIHYSPGGEMERVPLPARAVPHIAVPTTAGSASDVMPTAACRDPQSRRKLLFWDHALTPAMTVLDPEMAVHTPPALTAATGMTAMARAVESLYSGKRHAMSTGLALHAVRLLRDALPRAIATPHDLEARAACQMACTMSGMAAINAMVSVVHAIGHIVGGRHGLQHGISHAILLGPAMRLMLPVIGDQQTLLLDALGGRRSSSADSDGAEATALMASFVGGLPLPQRLRDLGMSEAELAEIAALTMSDYMMANLPRPMAEGEVLALLRSAW